MSITRAQADLELTSRGGQWLTLAGLVPPAAFDSPISYGLRQLGLWPADPTSPADADLAAAEPGDVEKFLDAAEVRLLENCLAGLGINGVDQTRGVSTQRLGQLRASLLDLIKLKRGWLQTRYGIGLGAITGGTIDLDFAEGYPEPLV